MHLQTLSQHTGLKLLLFCCITQFMIYSDWVLQANISRNRVAHFCNFLCVHNDLYFQLRWVGPTDRSPLDASVQTRSIHQKPNRPGLVGAGIKGNVYQSWTNTALLWLWTRHWHTDSSTACWPTAHPGPLHHSSCQHDGSLEQAVTHFKGILYRVRR